MEIVFISKLTTKIMSMAYIMGLLCLKGFIVYIFYILMYIWNILHLLLTLQFSTMI